MPDAEDLVNEYWEKFSKRTRIRSENAEKAFKDLFLKAFHEKMKQQKICFADEVRMISLQMGKGGIPRLVREVSRDKAKRSAFCEILNYVGSKPNDTVIVTKKVLKEMGWSGFTYGDFVLRCLELFVCMGMLQKKRFVKGKPGHRYVKKPHECEFADIRQDFYGVPEYFKCNFKWEEGAIIHGRYPEED